MREMKNSGIEWIGETPVSWNYIRGKYILSYLQKPTHETDEVITCFRDGEVTLRSNRREEGFTISDKEIGYQGIDPGDLVVHGMDGFAGAIGIADSRGKASPVLNVLDSKQNKRYIMYYLRNMAYSDVFLAIATGIRVRSCDLRWNKLAELLYPIPPLKEQQAIVTYIDRKCAEIDTTTSDIKKQIETLEQYKRSLITETVTKGLDPNVEMKNSGIKWFNMLPKNWIIGRLKDVVSVLTDYTANGSFGDLAKNVEYLDHEDYARLIRLTDLRENLNNIGIYVDEHSYKYLHKSSLHGGEILVANVGAYAGLFCEMPHVHFRATLAPNMFMIRSNEKMMQHYLLYLGNSDFVWEQLLQKAVSSAQPKLNKTDVKTVYIPIPPLSTQRSIINYLDNRCAEIDSIIMDKKEELKTLADYKKSLIYEYVTGKKEVPVQ